jgi:hypothetical protein
MLSDWMKLVHRLRLIGQPDCDGGGRADHRKGEFYGSAIVGGIIIHTR